MNDFSVPLSWNTNVTAQQQEIVDKCLAFSEGTKNVKNIDTLQKVAQGLQLSESTINGIEGMQLADGDVTTPFVGNWTTGSLNMVIQEVGSSVQQDTILSMAFPDISVNAYRVILDKFVASSGIAPEFSGENTVLPTSRPLDSYILDYEPALYALRTMLNAKDIFFARKRGMGTFEDRGIGQLVAVNTANIVTQLLTRKNYMLNQAVFYNGFTYNGQTIGSNIPSGNYIAMSQSLGTLNSDGSVTYSNIDPYYTPLIAINNILANPKFLIYRPYVKAIVVNGQDLIALMNHPNVKAVTNLMMAGSSKEIALRVGDQVRNLNAYYTPGFDYPLVADDGVWLGQNADGTPNQNSQNFFVPRGRMFVLLDLTKMQNSMSNGQLGAFHLTNNEVDPNMDSPAKGLYTGVFTRNLTNADTTNRIDIVGALAGAPAVYRPEACFVLTGLYSNV